MIRSRSSIIKFYKLKHTFLWYKSVLNTHEWCMTISMSFQWKLSWYDNLWINYIYKLRSFDSDSMKWRRMLRYEQPSVNYKNYINKTKYQVNEVTVWRRIKYGIMFNYAYIIEIFIKRLGRLIHFFKNDYISNTTYFQMLVPFSDKLFKYETSHFSLSKTYWNHFIKRNTWSILWYKKNIFKYSHMYSVFSNIYLLPYNLNLTLKTIFQLKIAELHVYNTPLTVVKLVETEELLNTILDTDYQFVINQYHFNHTLQIIIELYKQSYLLIILSTSK